MGGGLKRVLGRICELVTSVSVVASSDYLVNPILSRKFHLAAIKYGPHVRPQRIFSFHSTTAT